MARREVIVLVCDVCGAESDTVTTHELSVDGKVVELEVCGKDWGRAET